MMRRTSVAMAEATGERLRELLIRPDGQEDLCLALYRPSTGTTRRTGLISRVIPPEAGDREVHGNVTVTADYILRGAAMAQAQDGGLVILHSHPGAKGWQGMSTPDLDTERSYANLVRELTGLPLIGMTLATGDGSWSARHWDQGVGAAVAPTGSENVRVIGDQLKVSWNDALAPPPAPDSRLVRTVSAWGQRVQADLARRRILVVGSGSVGLDVVVRLAASGVEHITIMDFDWVEERNLDRLIGASRRDVAMKRSKVHVARREALRNTTAAHPTISTSDRSICEPAGMAEALDHDLIFCCVDRPWPRAVLNGLAHTDLIPVIDGGIAIDTFNDSTMRNATWRSHVIRPGRPCMSCNGQLDMGLVALDVEGLLDDPDYIRRAEGVTSQRNGQNVAVLSISAAAALLAQYVSFSVAPGGLGDPGPLQYVLSTHYLERVPAQTSPNCLYEPAEPPGDGRQSLTGRHRASEAARLAMADVSGRIRLMRVLDDVLMAGVRALDRQG
jgi:hypothetical protein